MEVILMEDRRRLGKRGEVVRVKPGYARNFLLPQGIARVATKGNLAYFTQQKKKIDARHTKAHDEAAAIAARIAEIKLEIPKRVGEKMTLYGSVTTAEIAELLAKKGVTVDKRSIGLADDVPGLKSVGEHKVTIDLHTEVVAELVVSVVPEE